MLYSYDFNTIWFYGITTYLILLNCWLIICMLFESIEVLGIWKNRKLQKSPSWSLKEAIKMSIINWIWLPWVLIIVSPILKNKFPVENYSLSIYNIYKLIVFFLIDDSWFYFTIEFYMYIQLYTKNFINLIINLRHHFVGLVTLYIQLK